MNWKKHTFLTDYRDYIIFAIVLCLSNWIWKICVNGEDSLAAEVTLLGIDITSLFEYLMQHIAGRVSDILTTLGEEITYNGAYTFILPNHNKINIVWACTPIKQMFIWICLMIFALPQSWHKIWYIPLGMSLIYGLNIWRIVIVILLVIPHPEWFEILHSYILKYLFYGVIFLMWLLWGKLHSHQSID